jgi:hypothetical protein
LPEVKKLYSEIARQEEETELHFQSELNQCTFTELLHLNRQRDMAAQRTTGAFIVMTWYLILVVNYSKISLHRASEKVYSLLLSSQKWMY